MKKITSFVLFGIILMSFFCCENRHAVTLESADMTELTAECGNSETALTDKGNESTNAEPLTTEEGSGNSGISFRVAFGFVDNCVLQRDMRVRVYGYGGISGHKVTVTYGDQVNTGTIKHDGWEVYLNPMSAQADGRDLLIEYDKIKYICKNVVVGDVFLCSGQSNMSVSYNYIHKKDASVEGDYHKYDNYSNLRFLNVPIRERTDNIEGIHHSWLTYDTVEKGGNMSALALSFASNLSAMLGDTVPVGIIHCSVPGSSIETWLDYNSISGLTHFSEETSEWSVYYYGMLNGFDGYTIRALLWYQGETDSEPQMVSEYSEKFSRFVNLVRKDNKNGELPIITFQLVQYKWVPWQKIRQIQFEATQNIKNVYMVCGIDTGCNIPDNPTAFAADGIHDTKKWLLGQRAAGITVSELLKIEFDDLYVKTSYGNTPYLSSAIRNGNEITVSVEDAASLMQSNGKLSFFEVYDGKEWMEVEAELRGNKIILAVDGSAEVIRYLNEDVFPEDTAFVYNEYGNPVPPTTGIPVWQQSYN